MLLALRLFSSSGLSSENKAPRLRTEVICRESRESVRVMLNAAAAGRQLDDFGGVDAERLILDGLPVAAPARDVGRVGVPWRSMDEPRSICPL